MAWTWHLLCICDQLLGMFAVPTMCTRQIKMIIVVLQKEIHVTHLKDSESKQISKNDNKI